MRTAGGRRKSLPNPWARDLSAPTPPADSARRRRGTRALGTPLLARLRPPSRSPADLRVVGPPRPRALSVLTSLEEREGVGVAGLGPAHSRWERRWGTARDGRANDSSAPEAVTAGARQTFA